VDGSALTAGIVLPGGTWPSFGDPNSWPVIKAIGHFSLPTIGRGTLIVTGNLGFSGSKDGEGVVRAGGLDCGDYWSELHEERYETHLLQLLPRGLRPGSLRKAVRYPERLGEQLGSVLILS